jgi:hypothetical protein
VPAATEFRSTWLSASLRSLRERELFDSYLASIPDRHRDAVQGTVVGVWLPVEVAVAHYRACDALGLPQNEIFAIGCEVTRRVHGTLLSTAVRLVTEAGVTPWTIFAQLNRIWARIWVGGAICVLKVGPKEARLEIVGWPCSASPYTRVAMRGVLTAMSDMFCSKTYVSELPRLCTSTTLGYRIAWA